MSEASLDDALLLTISKFQGVTDEDGEPYILHCLRVMMAVDDPQARLVALMHDLVEDTDVTLEDLRSMGFAPAVLKAVELVTHQPHQSYADYVVALSHDTLAREVKLADLRDNSALSRVLYRPDRQKKDLARIQKYVLSHQFLQQRLDEWEYRQRMQALE